MRTPLADGRASTLNVPPSASLRSRMPSSPRPGRVDGRIETLAVVDDDRARAAARRALELDDDLGRRRMLARVRQALLHDAIEIDARVVAEVVAAAGAR